MGFNDKQQHLLLENEKSLYALVIDMVPGAIV